uniref:Uncharacterized protein n=1 Tax=Anguilla anguilla TaxID=7936 RepID=A0A0E9XL87_ANGAN
MSRDTTFASITLSTASQRPKRTNKAIKITKYIAKSGGSCYYLNETFPVIMVPCVQVR